MLAGLAVRRTDVPPADAAGVVAGLAELARAIRTAGCCPTTQLRAWVAWGRAHGVPVVADECYVTLGWDVEPRSLLHPAVAGDDHTGLLAVHSLSKQSNAAGYRAGLLSGDPALVRRVWEVRRHLGLLVPGPVQAAMVAALDDDAHVEAQRERYRARRDRLAAAVRAAGARIDHSEAGPLPVGHPRRGLLDDDRLARRPRHRRRAGHLLRPGRRPARAHGAHRHRRADRRRGGAPRQLSRRDHRLAASARRCQARRGARLVSATGAPRAQRPRRHRHSVGIVRCAASGQPAGPQSRATPSGATAARPAAPPWRRRRPGVALAQHGELGCRPSVAEPSLAAHRARRAGSTDGVARVRCRQWPAVVVGGGAR